MRPDRPPQPHDWRGNLFSMKMAYDLLRKRTHHSPSTPDAALDAFKHHHLKKINVLSSSMVYESTDVFPTPEGAQRSSPPPKSTYGFQKLACEYFAQGAWEQYQLPFTIIRPFNCVGTGEKKALSGRIIASGNLELALSHVVPDLIQKIARGQDPLHLLGSGINPHLYGARLARDTALASSPPLTNFNFSTSALRNPPVGLGGNDWKNPKSGQAPILLCFASHTE